MFEGNNDSRNDFLAEEPWLGEEPKKGLIDKIIDFFASKFSFLSTTEIEIGGKEILLILVVLIVLLLFFSGFFSWFFVKEPKISLVVKVDKKSGFAPLKVSFDASESIIEGINVKKLEYDFKDGTTFVGEKTEHTFEKPGVYVVEFKVITEKNEIFSSKTTITVKDKTTENKKPMALIKINPSFPKTDTDIEFNGSDSYDLDGSITSYNWIFSDGFTSTKAKFSRRFSASGSYTVTLKVKDNFNAENSTTITFTVQSRQISQNQPPVADFTFYPLHPVVNQSVSFNSTSSDDGSIVSFSWDFGDGSTASGSQVSHSFSSAGSYSVSLTVVDDQGLSSFVSKTVVVSSSQPQNQPPTLTQIYVNPSSPKVGCSASFSSNASDPENQPLSFLWAFGDNTTSNLSQPTHVYNNTGTYNVNLTVSDGSLSTSLTKSISVTTNTPPSLSVSVSNSNPTPGSTIQLSGTATDDDGIQSVWWDYSWTSQTVDATGYNVSATVPNSSGQYTITFYAKDNCNAQASKAITITVQQQGSGPYLEGMVFPNISAPSSSDIPAQLSVIVDTLPVSELEHLWVYIEPRTQDQTILLKSCTGEDGMSHSQLFYFVPISAGHHNIDVTAVDKQGSSSTFHDEIEVMPFDPNNHPPTGSISCNPTTIHVGETTQCTLTVSDPDPGDTVETRVYNEFADNGNWLPYCRKWYYNQTSMAFKGLAKATMYVHGEAVDNHGSWGLFGTIVTVTD